MFDTSQAATVEAVTQVRCFRLGAVMFQQLVGESSVMAAAMEKHSKRWDKLKLAATATLAKALKAPWLTRFYL